MSALFYKKASFLNDSTCKGLRSNVFFLMKQWQITAEIPNSYGV